MSAALADTFYWIALTLPGDAAYASAHAFKDNVVTIDEVLTEYLNFFSGSAEYLRRKAAANVKVILSDPTVQVIPQTRESFLAGLELYRSRPDQGYSLTDCISTQTMHRERLSEALTNLHFFGIHEQAERSRATTRATNQYGS